MGMLYVAIFLHFLCSHVTSVFTVDNILNKVEKVNIRISTLLIQRSTTVVYNELSVSV